MKSVRDLRRLTLMSSLFALDAVRSSLIARIMCSTNELIPLFNVFMVWRSSSASRLIGPLLKYMQCLQLMLLRRQSKWHRWFARLGLLYRNPQVNSPMLFKCSLSQRATSYKAIIGGNQADFVFVASSCFKYTRLRSAAVPFKHTTGREGIERFNVWAQQVSFKQGVMTKNGPLTLSPRMKAISVATRSCALHVSDAKSKLSNQWRTRGSS